MATNLKTKNTLPGIFCALDTADAARAKELAAIAARIGLGLKVGLEFFNANGPQGVRDLTAAGGAPLFLDLKYHDIPNTVAGAVRAAVSLHPAYLNVHAGGGAAMMRAAKAAAKEEAARLKIPAPRLLGVTVLTSLDADALHETGVGRDLTRHVLSLTELTLDSGLDGVVCSAHEIESLRVRFGPEPVLMVPGIRPAGPSIGKDDQRRIMSPKDAMDAGATHLVIGRPITGAEDPMAAAAEILGSL